MELAKEKNIGNVFNILIDDLEASQQKNLCKDDNIWIIKIKVVN